MALQTWPRHRHRRLILDVLSESKEGIASSLESHYHRDVELPHGLPRGRRGERITLVGRPRPCSPACPVGRLPA
jgi:hypothetical protein